MIEYLLTYLHINGSVIGPKHIRREKDLDEIEDSPLVRDILSITTIDFREWEKTKQEHSAKVNLALRGRVHNDILLSAWM